VRPIPSAPGYFACEEGFIWRRGTKRISRSNGHGYLSLKLSVQNVQWDAYVHRLVCEAYHGPCPEGLQCRHLDGNRQNNRPENLRWSDKATNEADKQIHGTAPKGEKHGASTLTPDIVLTARKRAAAGERVDHIAADMGIPYRGLLDAVTGRRWPHLPGAVTNLAKGHEVFNEAIGEIESVAFEDDDGVPATLVTIRVPSGSRWGVGKVWIMPYVEAVPSFGISGEGKVVSIRKGKR
jgi:hypothetical protein